jgi:hypothetical protein
MNSIYQHAPISINSQTAKKEASMLVFYLKSCASPAELQQLKELIDVCTSVYNSAMKKYNENLFSHLANPNYTFLKSTEDKLHITLAKMNNFTQEMEVELMQALQDAMGTERIPELTFESKIGITAGIPSYVVWKHNKEGREEEHQRMITCQNRVVKVLDRFCEEKEKLAPEIEVAPSFERAPSNYHLTVGVLNHTKERKFENPVLKYFNSLDPEVKSRTLGFQKCYNDLLNEERKKNVQFKNISFNLKGIGISFLRLNDLNLPKNQITYTETSFLDLRTGALSKIPYLVDIQKPLSFKSVAKALPAVTSSSRSNTTTVASGSNHITGHRTFNVMQNSISSIVTELEHALLNHQNISLDKVQLVIENGKKTFNLSLKTTSSFDAMFNFTSFLGGLIDFKWDSYVLVLNRNALNLFLCTLDLPECHGETLLEESNWS